MDDRCRVGAVFRPMRTPLAAVCLSLAACGSPRHGSHEQLSPQATEGVATLRAATNSFVSLDSAVAAGYNRDVAMCFVDSIHGHGAMGYHHVNRSLVDALIEVERPEILLYERLDDGRYVFNGVEYILLYRFWPRDSVAPTVLAQTMLRDDDRNYWYLHVWTIKHNPLGIFADWNPGVRCPPRGSSRP